MSTMETTKVYVIRESITGELIKFGTKCGWASEMAAKNAFNLHMRNYFELWFDESSKGLFDKQIQFKIEEVK